jgi:L-seryl-tRNA(Ser) seleniumtransferase
MAKPHSSDGFGDAADGELSLHKQIGEASAYQRLPSVSALLDHAAHLVGEHGHTLVAKVSRELLDGHRTKLRAGVATLDDLAMPALLAQLDERIHAKLASRLQPVFNLTGTVIHTNLGRSLLPEAALHELQATMAGPNNLEYDLASGGRGDRDDLVESLLIELTGAQAATVVNNNAAAVLLTLAALARDREVIVSRGELVEIGGAFRMPDVMAAAGAKLVEVGTTNRTHPRDYEKAMTSATALIMKVHTSNYVVQGFTQSVDEADLVGIAHAHGVPLATDLGSGALIDLAALGLPKEPMPQAKLKAGCDVVTFSGDKLLGGPQAGLIVGSKQCIERIRRFPLKRALRMGKLPLAVLASTLQLYLRPERLTRDVPTLRLLTRAEAEIRKLAEQLLPAVAQAVHPGYTATIIPTLGQIGSGSLPVDRLPSVGIAIEPATPRRRGLALEHLATVLRSLPIPVLGRVKDDSLILDLRCLEATGPFLAQMPALEEALA